MPDIDDELVCGREEDNDYDSYAVAVVGSQGDIKAIIFCNNYRLLHTSEGGMVFTALTRGRKASERGMVYTALIKGRKASERGMVFTARAPRVSAVNTLPPERGV